MASILDTISGLLQSLSLAFSWPKLLYTFILIALAAVLITEIGRLWIDRGLYVQNFEYFDAGTPNAANGEAFSLRLLDRHAELRQRFVEAEKAQYADELMFSPHATGPIARSESVLSDLGITVQQINVTDILGRLRRWVSTPHEIRGSLSKAESTYRSTVRISGGSVMLADGSKFNGTLLLEALKDEDSAAFDIACSLIWLEAAKTQKPIAIVPREEFCHWTDAWSQYSRALVQSKRLQGLDEVAQKDLVKLLELLTKRIASGVQYPKYYSLRADVAELLATGAEPSARPTYLGLVQSDRLRYLVLLDVDAKRRDPKSEPLDDAAALPLLAKYRPALPVAAGKLPAALDDTWKRILSPAANSIERASLATGLFRIYRKDTPGPYIDIHAVGFAVAPNIIATAKINVLINELTKAPETGGAVTIPDEYFAEFVFADSWPSASDGSLKRNKIKRILFLGAQVSDIAYLEIEGHDVAKHPPLSITRPREIQVRANDYAAVIGYPARDTRVPPEFLDALLGTSQNIMRVMPGRVLSNSIAGTLDPTPLDANRIVTDCSTLGGVAGGPLIDLHSGSVMGMAVAGRWLGGDMGKFQYSFRRERFFASEAMFAAFDKDPSRVSFDELVASLPKPPDVVDPASESTDGTEPSLAGRKGFDSKFLGGPPIPLPMIAGSARLDYTHFTILLDPARRMPAVIAQNMNGSQLRVVPRPPQYRPDPRASAAIQLDPKVLAGSGLDRSSLVNRLAVSWGTESEARAASLDAFYYSSLTPQHPQLNRRSWFDLERFVREYVQVNGLRASVFTGPVFDAGDPHYKNIQLPQGFWMVIVIDGPEGTYRVAAFLLRQSFTKVDVNSTVEAEVPLFDSMTHRVPITSIEKLTGLSFGTLGVAKEF
jgi:DNA/RNA endonuclease G (NUC1)